MSEITVVEVAPQLVLGTRQKGKYEEIANLIPKVYGYAGSIGAQIAGPPIFICHETSPEEAQKADSEGSADIEIACPIDEKIDETEDIKCYELPGGQMSKIVYKGPYKDCEPAYEKMYAWLTDNNRKLIGPTREYYMNDPNEVKPEDILTEIYFPIE